MTHPIKGKLVRDKYPQGYDSNCTTLKLSPPLHQIALRMKIIEELNEIAEEPWAVEEWADFFQAVDDFVAISGIEMDLVRAVQHAKALERGTFIGGKFAWTNDPNYMGKPE